MWKPVMNHGVVNDRKWELKHNDVVLGTIYLKPVGKFSVWVSTPIVFDQSKRKYSLIGQTYQYETLEKAKEGFAELLKEHVATWATAVADYVCHVTEPDNS